MKSCYLTVFKTIIVTSQELHSLGYFSNQGSASGYHSKKHFKNPLYQQLRWIEISFILTQSAGSFQGTNLRNCEDFKRDLIFYQ